MPSKNKRINLTVPESVWNDLFIVQKRHYNLPMATICLCLIEQRLLDLKSNLMEE